MEQSNNYVKFFNMGYKVSKFNPELVELLQPSLKQDKEEHKALKDGFEQAQKEKEQERMKELEDLKEPNQKHKGKEDKER
jgi:hypothetical protein